MDSEFNSELEDCWAHQFFGERRADQTRREAKTQVFAERKASFGRLSPVACRAL